MSHTPLVISLPIEDRRTSFAFYRDGLGLDAVGERRRTASRSHCSSPSTTACASS